MRSNILLYMVLGKVPSSSAFVNHHILPVKTTTRAFDRNRVFAAAKENNDAIFDAEQAAAFDAHDASDPGMEGAAMERAVIMAEEFKEQQKQKRINEISEVGDAEANFAHDLADAAAVEHANEIPVVEDSGAKENDTTLYDAEEAAAVDAHDVSDAGVEGAAMERSVVMAEELYKELQAKKMKDNDSENNGNNKGDGKNRVTAGDKDNESTLFDAEQAAAVDAHDISDAGVEGAAMERAVIMAEEFKEQQKQKRINEISEARDSEANFAHDLADAAAVEHANEIPVEDSGAKENDTTLYDAEEAAAVDAHDVSDAGVEGAAMERSVVMAEELYKELQAKKKEEHKNGSFWGF